MGLFGKKKDGTGEGPEAASEGAPAPPSSTSSAAIPKPPSSLLPPSAQKSAAAPPASATPPRQGPTPPGGMLPKPNWHQEFEAEVKSPGPTPSKTFPSPDRPTQSQQNTPPATADARSRAGGGSPVNTQPVIDAGSGQPISLRVLLREAVERGASDLHLSRGVPPTIRLDGYLMPLNYPPLGKETLQRLIYSALNNQQLEKFEQDWELDLSLEVQDAGRFRVNVHRQRGGVEGAFRVVNDVILPLRRLGMPGVVEEIARKHAGLVLITGPTGSGKTTTLAAIVDQINNERQCMVVTIEDPIEYVHTNKRSIIKQREVTSDTQSFGAALRHVLRQDPDVIVIGEMRDLETIQTALVAAETGHLVFATLHTPDAAQTIDRIIDVFPPHQQEQVRIQLANTIQAICSQQLLAVPGNRGRVVACEILIANVAVRKLVRTAKTEQLYTSMQTSWEQGMITMDKSLKTLYQQGLISYEDAMTRCKFPSEFENI